MMSTNLYAMTMNPYFMANPHNLMMANHMTGGGLMGGPMMGAGMMGAGMMGAGMMGTGMMNTGMNPAMMGGDSQNGTMKYNGDGFEQSYLNQGQMQADPSQMQGEMGGEMQGGEENMII
jgi:hypothetical protein